MKWRAPSERTQMRLASIALVPLAPVWLPIVGLLIAAVWLGRKLTPSREWHRWFAWRPIPLGHWSERDGWAWLETVERRSMPFDWPTEYRLVARIKGPTA